jgi:hypothetical protein
MKLTAFRLCSSSVVKIKKAIRPKVLLVPMLVLFAVTIFGADPNEPTLFCATDACAKQSAILRQLERTRPSKKLSRKQIFIRVKAACDKMRSLDCPGIREFKPSICFTDF